MSSKRGQLFFPSDFLELGNETAIHQTFSRLAKSSLLIRLGHGIYLYPRFDKEFGILYPSIEEIAQAIAKKEKIQIKPTGSFALNKLGLSTQVPMKLVYQTDGMPRTIKVGKTTINFRKTTPKKLALKGKISGLVITALQELGKKEVTEEVLARIGTLLQKEEVLIIREDAKLAPAWIARILYSIIDKMQMDAGMVDIIAQEEK